MDGCGAGEAGVNQAALQRTTEQCERHQQAALGAHGMQHRRALVPDNRQQQQHNHKPAQHTECERPHDKLERARHGSVAAP